jgi:glycosyltransferase involved in cell wall biosynthesis
MPVKICYIISDIEKALAFEWIAEYLDPEYFRVHFILLGKQNTPLISFFKLKGVAFNVIPFHGKKDFVKAWIKVFSLVKKEKPDVVHTHLFFANIIGLSVAFLLQVPKRIHTRHHAAIHHQYFPKSVYIDKLVNRLSTDIIVLCNTLKEIVVDWEKTNAAKVHLVPHGFDLAYFRNINLIEIENVRIKHQIPNDRKPVIGVISRYTNWKGIQFIIPAFKKLLSRQPAAHLVLSNAHGDYSGEIKRMLQDLPADSYTEIVFEENIVALYRLFDVFVHTPIDRYAEAFGQTYVEALAAGVPSVFTLSGIANDFIRHEKNALVVDYQNSDEIENAMERLVTNGVLRDSIVEAGRISVSNDYSLKNMLLRLTALYTKK